jgi:hypothetical protein
LTGSSFARGQKEKMNTLVKWIKNLFYRMHLDRERRNHFKKWEKRIKRVDQLNPKDRAIWYEEEEEKWKAWRDEQ